MQTDLSVHLRRLDLKKERTSFFLMSRLLSEDHSMKMEESVKKGIIFMTLIKS